MPGYHVGVRVQNSLGQGPSFLSPRLDPTLPEQNLGHIPLPINGSIWSEQNGSKITSGRHRVLDGIGDFASHEQSTKGLTAGESKGLLNKLAIYKSNKVAQEI